MKVVVLGPMGAGKSTVGQLVSERLGAKMVDSDRVIESEYGRSGRQIAASDGVLALHDIEARVLSDALDAEGDAVIAPAASAVERPELRERLKPQGAEAEEGEVARHRGGRACRVRIKPVGFTAMSVEVCVSTGGASSTRPSFLT
jgi:dephospho-CoA kinase